MNINVQFADKKKLKIVSYFSDVQVDNDAYPNQGEIDTSDERWKAYYDSQPEFVKTMIPQPS